MVYIFLLANGGVHGYYEITGPLRGHCRAKTTSDSGDDWQTFPSVAICNAGKMAGPCIF